METNPASCSIWSIWYIHVYSHPKWMEKNIIIKFAGIHFSNLFHLFGDYYTYIYIYICIHIHIHNIHIHIHLHLHIHIHWKIFPAPHLCFRHSGLWSSSRVGRRRTGLYRLDGQRRRSGRLKMGDFHRMGPPSSSREPLPEKSGLNELWFMDVYGRYFTN